MNPETKCAIHPEAAAIAYCRQCGRAVCEECGRHWQGVLHCVECMTRLGQEASAGRGSGTGATGLGPSSSASGSAQEPRGDGPSAILALVLGLIPGVGAVYNGQYAKGVVHVVIFGGLISLLNSDASQGAGTILALLTALMFFYMPLEAYRTARALEQGRPVDELSGFLDSAKGARSSPLGGIVLIVLGVVFLLQSLGYWRLVNLLPYWPVCLIALGIYMLYRRAVEGPQMEIPTAAHSDSHPRTRTLDLDVKAAESEPQNPSSEGRMSALDARARDRGDLSDAEGGGRMERDRTTASEAHYDQKPET